MYLPGPLLKKEKSRRSPRSYAIQPTQRCIRHYVTTGSQWKWRSKTTSSKVRRGKKERDRKERGKENESGRECHGGCGGGGGGGEGGERVEGGGGGRWGEGGGQAKGWQGERDVGTRIVGVVWREGELKSVIVGVCSHLCISPRWMFEEELLVQ